MTVFHRIVIAIVCSMPMVHEEVKKRSKRTNSSVNNATNVCHSFISEKNVPSNPSSIFDDIANNNRGIMAIKASMIFFP